MLDITVEVGYEPILDRELNGMVISRFIDKVGAERTLADIRLESTDLTGFDQ